MNSPPHGVVLLAAGASRRLGRSKQLVEIDGETLVERAAHSALATAPLDGVIVLGHGAAQIAALLSGLPLRSIVANDWQRGMGHSLAAGVAALHAGCSGVLIVLCDQPALESAHLRRLVATWQLAPSRAVASAYAGTLGVPALLPRSWLEQPGVLTGDRGARELLRIRIGQVTGVPNPALAHDVDEPDDLLNGATSTSDPQRSI